MSVLIDCLFYYYIVFLALVYYCVVSIVINIARWERNYVKNCTVYHGTPTHISNEWCIISGISFLAHDKTVSVWKLRLMPTATFGSEEITEKTRGTKKLLGSSYYYIASVACRSSSRQNEGLRVAERTEQIPTLQTANNSLSVAARIVSQNKATVFTMRFRDVIKKSWK